MKRTLSTVLCLYALLVCCKGPEQAGATAAETTYTLELLRCVDAATTLLESKACRQRVNTAWGIVEKEAGR